MAWDEARAWLSGTLNGNLYQNLLDDALARPARNARRKKIIHPEDIAVGDGAAGVAQASLERTEHDAGLFPKITLRHRHFLEGLFPARGLGYTWETSPLECRCKPF
jgi:hypothetical protein